MLWELGCDDELPHAETEEKEEDGHREDAEPLVTVSGVFPSKTVVANVFSEIGPVCFGGIGETAFTVTCFEARQPQRFVESESVQIAANKAFAKDAAW